MVQPRHPGCRQDRFRKFHNFNVRSGSNPIAVLDKLESLGLIMNEREMPADDLLLYTRFLDALPREYTDEVRMLQGQATVSRDDIILKIGQRFSRIGHKKGASSGDQAFFAGEDRGRDASRRGRGRGGRGRGRGRSKQSGDSDGQRSGGDGARTGDSSRAAGDGVKRERGKCYRCMQPGHFRADCTAKQCTSCAGFGHSPDVCPTGQQQEAVLAVDLPAAEEKLAAEAEAFMVEVATGECNDVGCVGGVELARQSGGQSWTGDSASTSHVTYDSGHFTNYRKVNNVCVLLAGVLFLL